MTTRYLGDGVYAKFVEDLGSDTMLKLWTSNGITETNIIFLEPQVYDALVAFVASCKAAPTEEEDT